MKCIIQLIYLLSACIVSSIHAHPPHRKDPQAVASKQIKAWQKQYHEYIFKTLENRTSGCTKDKLQYRREWGSLTPKDRIDYTTAVRCLQKKPNKISNTRVPGARTRFDDVIASHIFQSPFIHFSGIFLHWHRYYTYLYDQLLRTECNYTGPQPYWDWTLTYKDPRTSKIFDGAPDSMGSNGAFIPNRTATFTTAFGRNGSIPPATGGGCVTAGPFTDYVVNLGPAVFEPRIGSRTGLDYNPRCLKRDVSLEFANHTKPTDVVDLIGGGSGNNEGLEGFSAFLEKKGGLHGSGHFTIGGDPGNDGLWTVWQGLHPERRYGMVFGTGTADNNPPSANVTLDTKLNFEVLAPPITVREVDSTIDGPFCYIYL
ncbi:MAG: hypothetical protein L6R40_008491 [Gallowayella cf. fulva]|nr:MAG: hypothetical protein L6R40_008491 [Xanthomendoza cf. fulva]